MLIRNNCSGAENVLSRKWNNMKHISTLLLAMLLIGCQGEQNGSPEATADNTPSTQRGGDSSEPSSEKTKPDSTTQSVQEGLEGMGAVVVPNPNGGIKSVIFEGSNLSEGAIALVTQIPELEILSLSGVSIKDSELEGIGKLKNLKVLLLGSTQVTDVGLIHLGSLTELERLGLGDTQITDAGLKQLEGLQNLKMLFLSETGVTDKGVTTFRAAVPDCQIER